MTFTLEYAVPGIFLFMVGACPIFAAFLYSFFCMFENSTRYVDLKTTYLTLIAYLTGNDTQGNLFDVLHIRYGIIFVFLFGVVFLFGIANVFVFVIETSYERVRREMDIRFKKKKMSGFRDFFVEDSEPNKIDKYLGVDKEVMVMRQEQETFKSKYQELKEEIVQNLDTTHDRAISDLLIVIDYINDLTDQYDQAMNDIREQNKGR